MNAAANVFVGLTEAPLAVRPFLHRLTEAQLFCVMVSGVASVAGTVLAAYALMGVRLDYLLAASFMAAPGGLAMAKLLMPDEAKAAEASEPPATPHDEAPRQATVVVAAAQGAADGLRLAVNIGAMLIAFVSLIALANGLLGWLGRGFGFDTLSLQQILGWVFAPVMYLLGVPWSEAPVAGSLFGQKLVLNEFVAFLDYGKVVEGLSPRAIAVTTISLCGFANLAAIAVLLGGLGGLVPEHKNLIGRLGLKAILAGSLSNLMSAGLVSLMLSF
jgi:CNT family concentrative nucleoside transporter